MDGKGCWRDNVFIERVWRSIKYEEVYLHAYETVSAAREGIGRSHQPPQHAPAALEGSTIRRRSHESVTVPTTSGTHRTVRPSPDYAIAIARLRSHAALR